MSDARFDKLSLDDRSRAGHAAAQGAAIALGPLALPAPRAFLVAALALIALTGLLSSLASVFLRNSDADLARFLFNGFWIDREENFPTLVNFSLLVIASGLLALIASTRIAHRDPWRWHWLAMTFVFLLLCFDEAASFHERLIAPLRAMLPVGGLLHFAWVIPGMAFVALFTFSFWRFVANLPRQIGLTMIAAGAVFCGGALGVEMFGAAAVDAYGTMDTPIYALATTLEEMMEMSGLALFATALLMVLSAEADRR